MAIKLYVVVLSALHLPWRSRLQTDRQTACGLLVSPALPSLLALILGNINIAWPWKTGGKKACASFIFRQNSTRHMKEMGLMMMIYPPVRGNGAWNYGRIHFCITHSGLLSVQGLQFRPLAVCNLGQWFVLLNREQSCSSYNDGFEGKHADSLQYRLKIGKNWVWRAFYRYSFFFTIFANGKLYFCA